MSSSPESSTVASPKPTLALLNELHERFTYGYTYNNFDVFLNGTNKLDKDTLVAKLDQAQRGVSFHACDILCPLSSVHLECIEANHNLLNVLFLSD